MLKARLIPTPLIHSAERIPIELREPRKRARRLLFWRQLARTLCALSWLRLRGRLTPDAKARRLRRLFEELGGFWIKVGQLISLRTDLLSPELCRELGSLQYRTRGFPFRTVRETVEAELGSPLPDCFDAFDEAPLAAASIAQVHRARLRREQIWVAVKIQRPGIAEAFVADLSFVRSLTRLFERLAIAPFFRWKDFQWELERILDEEVDYRYEAENLRRIKATLRRHRIYVPKVFRRYCTRRVLVMELIPAVLMSEVVEMARSDPWRLNAWFAENRIKPKRVGRALYVSVLRQILEDNLFHGDLHPGNIALLRDSRLALIDFGSVGSLDNEYRNRYALFMQALASGDYGRAVDLLFLLTHSLPNVDLIELKEALIRTFRSWERKTTTKGLPFVERSQVGLTTRIGEVMVEYKIPPEWTFLRLTRTTTALDASLMYLLPDADFGKLLARYFKAAERRRQAALGADPRGLLAWVIEGVMPGLRERDFISGTILRREARVLEGASSPTAELASLMFAVMALTAALAGISLAAVFLAQRYPALTLDLAGPAVEGLARGLPKIGSLGFGGMLTLLAVALLGALRFRKRFRRKIFATSRLFTS
jgi:ubiquinone biosynthesis protein